MPVSGRDVSDIKSQPKARVVYLIQHGHKCCNFIEVIL